MTYDFSLPEERAEAIQALGSAGYNRAYAKWREAQVVTTVNGYQIRPVATRFGRLFAIEGEGAAFATLEAAKEAALKLGTVE